MQHPHTRIASIGDIDVAAVWAVCKDRKRTLLAFVLSFFVMGVVALHFMPPMYTASLQVAPTQGSGTDVAGKLGGLSSLASMAGVNLPQDQGASLYRLYLAGIYSRSTADALSRRDDIMSQLFPNEWDAQTRTWHESSPGVLGYAIWGVKSVLGLRNYGWQPPNGARLQRYIANFVAIDQDPKKPLATISYSSSDPQFAVRFLAALHRAVDDQLRARTITRSQQYIKYLSDRLPMITNSEHREAVADILSNQEKNMMMTSAAGAYAAEPFGPPSVDDRPTSPKSSNVLLTFIAVGLGLGMALVLLQALGWVGFGLSLNRSSRSAAQAGE